MKNRYNVSIRKLQNPINGEIKIEISEISQEKQDLIYYFTSLLHHNLIYRRWKGNTRKFSTTRKK